MSFAFSAMFDPRSLAALGRMENFDILNAGSMQAALDYDANVILNRMVQIMWAGFMNPSGALEGSWQIAKPSPYEREIGSDVPYAHRRDVGFKGPDALGRMFPNDPALHYTDKAIEETLSTVEAVTVSGVEDALGRLGGG